MATVDVSVPSEQEFIATLGASPVRLLDGKATYSIAVQAASRDLVLTYDLVERSIRVRMHYDGTSVADFYGEGLEVMTLSDGGGVVDLSARLSGDGYVIKLHIGVFPMPQVTCEMLAA